MRTLYGLSLVVAVALAVAHRPAFAAEPAGSGDPVARLQSLIDRGQVRLSFDPHRGYLQSVLEALKVPAASQGLVFSKTSFQAARISPQTPRALYFNDDVYVGWVKNGPEIELASVDPAHGPAFYLLPQQKADRPRFVRQGAACMQCHQSQQTGDVPGLLMRSVFPDRQGMPVFSAGTYVTTEQSPMAERWGGWYLDGRPGALGMGNAVVDDPAHSQDLTHFHARFSALFQSADYLTAHSDPVALLVLAHQTHLHNLLTQAAEQTRSALTEERAIQQAIGQAPPGGDSNLPRQRLASICEPVVRCLLFSGEARLPSPVVGSTDFGRQFEQLGPSDQKGRSLREFDLRHRLFKYPCSYLIYSGQFDALPPAAKQYIYRRLWKILTGREDSRDFAHLSDPDRDAIYQILLQTKRDLPSYWKPRD